MTIGYVNKYATKEKALESLAKSYNEWISSSEDYSSLQVSSTEELTKAINESKFGDPSEFDTPEKISKNLDVTRILSYKRNLLSKQNEIESGQQWVTLEPCKVVEKTCPYEKQGWVEQILGRDPVRNTTLVAYIKFSAEMKVTTTDILDGFVKLNLQDRSKKGRGVNFYPSEKDRSKIIEFIEKHGPRFIECPNESRPGQLTYLEEFVRQYRDFIHCYRRILEPRPLAGIEASQLAEDGAIILESADQKDEITLQTINYHLAKIRYELIFLKAPTTAERDQKTQGINVMVPVVNNGILYCYAKLIDILRMDQHGVPCECCGAAVVGRSNKKYCNESCRAKARQRRHYLKCKSP